jgi:hypothetical protein
MGYRSSAVRPRSGQNPNSCARDRWREEQRCARRRHQNGRAGPPSVRSRPTSTSPPDAGRKTAKGALRLHRHDRNSSCPPLPKERWSKPAPPGFSTAMRGSTSSSLLARGEEEICHRRHHAGFARWILPASVSGGRGGEFVAGIGRGAPVASGERGANGSETCFFYGFAREGRLD